MAVLRAGLLGVATMPVSCATSKGSNSSPSQTRGATRIGSLRVFRSSTMCRG